MTDIATTDEPVDTTTFSYAVFYGRFTDNPRLNNLFGLDCREVDEFIAEKVKRLLAENSGLKTDLHLNRQLHSDTVTSLCNDLDRLEAENAKLKKDVEYAVSMAPLNREKINQLIHYRNETKRLKIENVELREALEQGDK